MVLFIEMIVTWAICAMIVFEVKQWAVSPTGNALILASVEVCLLLGANFPLLRIYIFFQRLEISIVVNVSSIHVGFILRIRNYAHFALSIKVILWLARSAYIFIKVEIFWQLTTDTSLTIKVSSFLVTLRIVFFILGYFSDKVVGIYHIAVLILSNNSAFNAFSTISIEVFALLANLTIIRLKVEIVRQLAFLTLFLIVVWS